MCLCTYVCMYMYEHVCLHVCLQYICTYLIYNVELPILPSLLLGSFYRSKLIAKTQSLFRQTKSPPVTDAEMVANS